MDDTVGITRTSSGISMSDDPALRKGPNSCYSMPFSPELLEGSEVDVLNSTWIEVKESSKLFPLIAAHVHQHSCPSLDGGGVQSLRIGEVEKATDQTERGRRAAATQGGKSTVSCGLTIGLGLFKFKAPFTTSEDEDATPATAELHALHQAIGDPVGCNCGVQNFTNIILFAKGRDKEAGRLLKSFCDLLLQKSEESEKDSFKIFRWHTRHNYWHKDATCRARPMDSVVLPSQTKDNLIKDLDEFLSEDSYDFYACHGIPYRRSYLFHGTPGSGKTSLITAIAGKYGRNVAYLQACHPELTDDNLKSAVQRAPARAIVVLEDIDGLFTKQREKKISKSPLTFSGLLNALDGIGNPAGQIFILTTNFREQLDEALVRNGRVDMHVQFTHADDEQIASMAQQFYPDPAVTTPEAIAFLIKALRDALGERPMSTAALQHYFVTQRRSTFEEVTANVSQVIKDMQEREAQGVEESKPEADSKPQDDAASKERGEPADINEGQAQQNVVVPPIHVHLHNAGGGNV